MRQVTLTAVLEREGDGYVALCPEVDVASQGDTLDEARANLREAVELFFETASEEEIRQRVPSDVRVEPLELTIG
ncbi:MAG TPA: type II toxin-antitoxin system HicB family antitoxin [Tepidisphaeraceae bacterium]|nr:type II toxin-antitoxin system HicB family antitoxin [Tepidisphaeraceae bacterium]